jgi:exodeoxyribonuclease V alpha subunit
VKEVSREGIENVQILSPLKENGEASAEKLNASIRELVNPMCPNKPELRIGARIFRINDRVMQTKNKGNISNGDVGFIRRIQNGSATIDFGDSRMVEYEQSGMGSIELAYAMTVHKAMGSEYTTVILPILSSHSIMLYRNLLYTAVTRAKRRVLLVGQYSTLLIAIHKNRNSKRNTMLAGRIRQYTRELIKHTEAA